MSMRMSDVGTVARCLVLSFVIVWIAAERPTRAAANRDVPLIVTSDAQSMSFIPSATVTDGIDLVSAVLRNDINIFVYLGSSNGKTASPRDLCIDLTAPVDNGAPVFAPYCNDLGSNSSGSEDMRHMSLGQTFAKRFQVAWTTSAGNYWLRFGDDAGTNRVAVTCETTDAAGCTGWTMSPEGGAGGSIARLTFLASAGRRSVASWVADYHVPFVWTVSLK